MHDIHGRLKEQMRGQKSALKIALISGFDVSHNERRSLSFML
jgi:hypothetical protein